MLYKIISDSVKKEKKIMSNKICPRCNSENIVRNGNTDYGKPRYMCKDCQRHFVENPAKGKISDEKKELIDRLLLEKIPLAGIARAVGVSTTWLQAYVSEKYRDVEKKQNRSPKIGNA
jgi:insertion element IS1 protein InsB